LSKISERFDQAVPNAETIGITDLMSNQRSGEIALQAFSHFLDWSIISIISLFPSDVRSRKYS